MYDPVTLDQLRALAAVAEEGSFSAAARKLHRVQSAVSTAMANLESQLGLVLWDRSSRVARLTDAGQAVLGAARRVLSEVDGLKRLTSSLAGGVETSVSLCLDAFFPLRSLTALCTAFAGTFPEVDLRVEHQVLSAVSARVLGGGASLGVVSSAGLLRGLTARALAPVRMLPVVSPQHPLASLRGRIAGQQLAAAIQIVLSEGVDAQVADRGVLSPRTWRVGDLHTKRELLRAGLGWGNLPEHLARPDLASGALVPIQPDAWGVDEHMLHLSVVYRNDAVLGPAHRWVVERLGALCAGELEPGRSAVRGRPAPRRRARARR